MSEIIYEDYEMESYDFAQNKEPVSESKFEHNSEENIENIVEQKEDISDTKEEEIEPSLYEIYKVVFLSIQDNLKDELIKQSMRALFESNPKFRQDESLIISVYNIMKQYLMEGKRHVFLNAPTGSGKTIIAFGVNFCFTYCMNMITKLMNEIHSYIDEKCVENSEENPVTFSDYVTYIANNRILLVMGNDGVMGFVQFNENNQPNLIKKLDKNIHEYYKPNFDLDNDNNIDFCTYLLTSNKLLQEQLDKDISPENFDLGAYYAMLKGSSNYECTLGTLENKTYTSFVDRSCQAMNAFEKKTLECLATCPYYVARQTASDSQTAILNYHFFLNSQRRPNLFFNKRHLTIADEGHLLPDIVTNIFNIELTLRILNRGLEIMDLLNFNFNSYTLNNEKHSNRKFVLASNNLANCYKYMTHKIHSSNEIVLKGFKHYMDELGMFSKNLSEYIKDNDLDENIIFIGQINKKYKKLEESLDSTYTYNSFYEKIKDRLEDLSFESNKNDFNLNLHRYEWFTKAHNIDVNSPCYNQIFRDLKESELVRENFINKTEFTLQLSATFVDMETHAETSVGILLKEDYKNLTLPQQFSYENSPIYITKSGFLNFTNFDSNIYNVMEDVMKITSELHPNEKGIIHTASVKINNILMDVVAQNPDVNFRNRFLFYSNSQEKEQAIKMMIMTDFPYIICGYSLYEGLDLKDDLGRFNIMIKVPFGGQTDYTKAKMKRYPKWYENDTIQKVCQGIGRTDRHKNDYSTTYLLDSMFDKFRFKLPSYIQNRIQTKRL